MALRTVSGLTLTRREQGWTDGRFDLYRDDSFTRYCQAPHPTRDNGYCEGDQPHPATEWCVWDRATGDYIDREAGGYPTLTEAAARVREWYAANPTAADSATREGNTP